MRPCLLALALAACSPAVSGGDHDAGPPCVVGVDCFCPPGQRSCDPASPQDVLICSDDGSRQDVYTTCDPTAGLVCSVGQCVSRCDAEPNAYLGCDYYAVQLANSQLDPSFSFAVTLANPQAYAVSATVEGGSLASARSVLLAPRGQPGDVQTVELPWISRLLGKRPMCFQVGAADPDDCAAKSARVDGGAFHIQADGAIAAYQFNPLHYETTGLSGTTYSYSNDASLLLPTRVLRTHYIVATYPNWSNDTLGLYSDPVTIVHGGLVSLVGTDPDPAGTHVTLQLTAAVTDPLDESVKLEPGSYSYTLRRGDVIQLAGTDGGQDLTGSLIDADHPLAVFTGNDCTQVPDGRPACDHLEEQLLPSETWGKQVAVSPLIDRPAPESFVVRLVSQTDGNALSFDGIAAPDCPALLGKGQLCEVTAAGPFVVTGTQPFLALQVMVGQGLGPHHDEVCSLHATDFRCDPFTGGPDRWCDDNPDDPICEGFQAWCQKRPTSPSCIGDPALVTEVPVEQYRDRYDIVVPLTYVFNYVNVVAPEGASVEMDGTPLEAWLDASSQPVGGGLVVWFIPAPPGEHHLEGGGARFGVKVYGVARYTSYMYPGGLDLAPISPVP